MDAGVERWAGLEPDVLEPDVLGPDELKPQDDPLRAWLLAVVVRALAAPDKPGAVLSAARSFSAPVFADEASSEVRGAVLAFAEPEPEVAEPKQPAPNSGSRAAPRAAVQEEARVLPLRAESEPAQGELGQPEVAGAKPAPAKPRAAAVAQAPEVAAVAQPQEAAEASLGVPANWARSAREPEA